MTNPRPQRRHVVSHEEAITSLRRRPVGLAERGGHVPRDAIDQVLAQDGCAGLRFYFGTNPDGSLAVVFVGIDEHERDMTDGVLINNHFPCPPFCDATSSLLL